MNIERSHRVRWTVVAALGAVALLVAACSSTPSVKPSTSTSTSTTHRATTTTTTQAAISNCTSARLSVSAGMSSGAAGTIGQVVLFENTSTTTCLLHAFPGVAGLDAAGNQVVQATREVNLAPFSGSTSTLPTVQLTPGSTASALVFGSDVPAGGATSCVTYAGLLVTPPNALQSVHLDVTMPGCAGLRVGPVYPGATGMAS